MYQCNHKWVDGFLEVFKDMDAMKDSQRMFYFDSYNTKFPISLSRVTSCHDIKVVKEICNILQQKCRLLKLIQENIFYFEPPLTTTYIINQLYHVALDIRSNAECIRRHKFS